MSCEEMAKRGAGQDDKFNEWDIHCLRDAVGWQDLLQEAVALSKFNRMVVLTARASSIQSK